MWLDLDWLLLAWTSKAVDGQSGQVWPRAEHMGLLCCLRMLGNLPTNHRCVQECDIPTFGCPDVMGWLLCLDIKGSGQWGQLWPLSIVTSFASVSMSWYLPPATRWDEDIIIICDICDPLWQKWAGLAWWLTRSAGKRKGVGSIPSFGSPFSSKNVIYGLCLVTLPCTIINETLKWLTSLPILMRKSIWWWQCSG